MSMDLGANYVLVDRIGGGAAGSVWRAKDKRTDGIVAAKILREEYAEDRDLVARFIQERSILLDLVGKPIVEVKDMVVEGSRLAIIMEFVEGPSLREVLNHRKVFTPFAATTVARHVLEALVISHGKNVVHRDIKPDNVLLKPDWEKGKLGSIKLTDFGISRLVTEGASRSTSLVGTPEYLAPELIERGEASFPADAYGVGILLYELLAGRTPFAGVGSDYAIAHRHVTATVPPLDVTPELWEVVDGLLNKRPHQRMTIDEALEKLKALQPTLKALPALEPTIAPENFEVSYGPMTVLRPGVAEPAPEPERKVDTADFTSAYPTIVPDLGEAPNQTVLRESALAAEPEPTVKREEKQKKGIGSKLPWKPILIGAGSLAAAAALIGIGYSAMSNKEEEIVADPVTVSSQDRPTPAGLGISREATFDPATKEMSISITYASDKVALEGPFFEVVEVGGRCPDVAWDLPGQKRNVAATTYISHSCGWALDPGVVEPGGPVTLTGTFTIADEEFEASGVQEWLGENTNLTASLLADPETVSTSYPAQRLVGIEPQVANRIRSGEPITVTLLPVWPSGLDEVNPIYVSPHKGGLTETVEKIAGVESNIRFSDGCAGAISVSRDGLYVMALRPASQCQVITQVGNFSNLSSNTFDIVGHES
ncbi:serine/threonine-protein kinase [Trueperella sp.]|uniref:serine/threonine-protein kinase n=1 Tax=Trueperella sp. TaxID=2699835 RepID=UPI0037364A65